MLEPFSHKVRRAFPPAPSDGRGEALLMLALVGGLIAATIFG